MDDNSTHLLEVWPNGNAHRTVGPGSMTRTEIRRRAHALAYQVLEQALDSGFVWTYLAPEEGEEAQIAIEEHLDKLTQYHFDRSDRCRRDKAND